MTERPIPADPTVPVEATLPKDEQVGDAPIDRDAIGALLDDAGVVGDRALIAEMVESALLLGRDRADRLDLKIAAAALAEMRAAFRIFQPYEAIPKVTIFGSARTQPSDHSYRHAHDVAAQLARAGWMVVTGAGPGIMAAAMEGAGAERSIGVSIRLPAEEQANAVIAGDPKLVNMKYFFTRKLMLVKESKAFLCVPGGFGTLDETLELLTLQQTGKGQPTPIVLVDEPGGSYWHGFASFVRDHLVPGGYVAPDDMDRVLVTDSVDVAVREVRDFYRNYDSIRWVGDRLVVRLTAAPTDEEVDELDREFRRYLVRGRLRRVEPSPAEQRDGDRLDRPRIAGAWDPRESGRLHLLIRAVNRLASAPAAEPEAPSP